jgi:hypothetical protein
MANQRIEVDLRVMQQEAIQKLEKFGTDFNNSIDRLLTLTNQMAGTGGGGGGNTPTGPAGQVNPQASTSGKTDMGVGNPGVNPSASASFGSGSIDQGMTTFNRRVGSDEMAIPRSFRQALGYYAEGQLQMNPFAGMGGIRDQAAAEIAQANREFVGPMTKDQYKAVRNRFYAGKANDLLFNLQANKAMAVNAMGKYSGFFGGAQGITDMGTGTNANASRSGWFGSGLFSGAFMHGLGQQFQALKESDFGLDPSYSLGQAQADMGVINSYGWSTGNYGSELAQTVKNNRVKFGVDAQATMGALDPLLRWGGGSFDQLNNALAAIPSSATAAGYTLQQFQQQLLQTTSAVAQSTGLPVPTIMSGIQAISASTGLNPQQAGNLYNMKNELMASGLSGQSLGQFMFGHNQSGLLKFPLEIFQNSLGMPINQWVRWFNHGTPAQKKRAQDAMAYGPMMLYQSNPDIFQGMQPLQMAHMLAQGGGEKGLLRNTGILDQLMGLSGKESVVDAKIHHLIRAYKRHDPSQIKDIISKFDNYAKGGYSNQERVKKAYQLLTSQKPAERRQTSNYMIGLTPDARKLITLIGHDPAHSNNNSFFGRASSSLGDSFHALESIGGSNPVDAAHNAFDAITDW